MMQNTLETISQMVRQARRTKKLSQTQLAQLSGVSRARIAALEGGRAGEITFRNLISILHTLDLDLRIVTFNRQRPTLDDLRAEDEE